MSYDLFISYSRQDEEQGGASQLVELIVRGCELVLNRPVKVFFDKHEIQDKDDWRRLRLTALRESTILLALVSPGYLSSEYSEWEVNEYLKREEDLNLEGEGIVQIYFRELPGWEEQDYDRLSADWVREVHRRASFDFRLWLENGQEVLRQATPQIRFHNLIQYIVERILLVDITAPVSEDFDAHFDQAPEMRRRTLDEHIAELPEARATPDWELELRRASRDRVMRRWLGESGNQEYGKRLHQLWQQIVDQSLIDGRDVQASSDEKPTGLSTEDPGVSVTGSLPQEIRPAEVQPLFARSPVAAASSPQEIQPYDEDVMFTVYRPATVKPEKWYPLLAFAHLSECRPDAPEDEPDPIEEVNREAQQLLGAEIANYKQSSDESGSAIPRSGEITFKPFIEGFEFNPSSRSFRWEESVHREEFKLRASRALDGQRARGRMTVYLGSLVLAQINLSIKVDSRFVSHAETEAATLETGRPFRKVFASYSHNDLEVVHEIEDLVRRAHLGLDYLRDATNLRSGEVWNESLERMIAEADIFQLFWSTNSMYSGFVRQEYEYALGLRKPDFVRPVFWQTPFPENREQNLPPEELKRIHFENLSESQPGIHWRTPATGPQSVRNEGAGTSVEDTAECFDEGREPSVGEFRDERSQPITIELAHQQSSFRDAPTGQLFTDTGSVTTESQKRPSCPRCGTLNRSQARFCPNCGAALTGTDQPQINHGVPEAPMSMSPPSEFRLGGCAEMMAQPSLPGSVAPDAMTPSRKKSSAPIIFGLVAAALAFIIVIPLGLLGLSATSASPGTSGVGLLLPVALFLFLVPMIIVVAIVAFLLTRRR